MRTNQYFSQHEVELCRVPWILFFKITLNGSLQQ